MFPKKLVIRYDFPARGAMPPVKLFWHDGLKETPKIAGVPEGELLGDLPDRPSPPRRPGSDPEGPPPFTGFIGDVFDFEKFQAVKNAPDAEQPTPDRRLLIGDKRMITTGTYGEERRLITGEKLRDYHVPRRALHRSPGH